jgi:hypothetical protein
LLWIAGLMQRGAAVRATGATRMNEMSSRSHALFIIIVEQTETYQVEISGICQSYFSSRLFCIFDLSCCAF